MQLYSLIIKEYQLKSLNLDYTAFYLDVRIIQIYYCKIQVTGEAKTGGESDKWYLN